MENSTLIHYCGSIRYETIGELIHKFKEKVPQMGMGTSIYKRILLIMIESLENIMKHSENTDDQVNLPVLSVSYANNRYIINSSNLLSVQQVNPLKARIDFLNGLDQQGLKSYYKETITDGVFSKSGGAGLGLIEIAKISGNPIIYEFNPVDTEYARYRQQITINAK